MMMMMIIMTMMTVIMMMMMTMMMMMIMIMVMMMVSSRLDLQDSMEGGKLAPLLLPLLSIWLVFPYFGLLRPHKKLNKRPKTPTPPQHNVDMVAADSAFSVPTLWDSLPHPLLLPE